MKLMTSLFAFGFAASAHAAPTKGDYAPVGAAAKTLVSAADAFAKAAKAYDARLGADGETLFDAAEHFEEEVELGPQDLGDDFETIEQSVQQVAAELARVTLPSASLATWNRLVDANDQLRTEWSVFLVGTTSPAGPVRCEGRDGQGDTYWVDAAQSREGAWLIAAACRQANTGCLVTGCRAR